MSISRVEVETPRATDVRVAEAELQVDISDGRTISVPLGWYPRLENGCCNERENWRTIGHGEGIHWINLDEDVSVKALLDGKPSGESQRSFKQWMGKPQEA